jgi:hypothetical protein
MTDAASPPETADARREALVERLFVAAVGTWDVLAVYIGDRLGLHRTLAERGPLTSAELAQAAGLVAPESAASATGLARRPRAASQAAERTRPRRYRRPRTSSWNSSSAK